MKLMYPTQTSKTIFTLVLAAALTVGAIKPAAAQSDYSKSSNNNLPALLLSFSAAMQSETAQLDWVMENQTSCKWFVIERSGNGSQFDSIAVVLGTNNTHESDYSFSDQRVLNGSNYYRLRQVDIDGTVKYSKVVVLNNSTVNNKVRVYPNPAVAVVNYTIEMPTTVQATVQVYNLAGAVVLTQQQTFSAGANQQSLAIGGLKNGNYFLKISAAGGVQYAQSFVKML